MYVCACASVRVCVVCLTLTVFSFSKDFLQSFFHSPFIPILVFISLFKGRRMSTLRRDRTNGN